MRWDKDGSNIGQTDVPNGFHTRGIWFVPLPVAGTYSLIIEGCDVGTFGSSCKQGWTVPVTITFTPPQVTPSQNPDCTFFVSGPILTRWLVLGGQSGPLGCPIENQHDVAATNASLASFQHGQIVWDPDRGTDFTLAVYQVESDIAVEWGPTDPFSYDDFNLLWSKDGIPAPQVQVGQYRDPLLRPIYPGPNNGGIYSIRGVGPGAYTVTIEGCDVGDSGSSCKQGWTQPVTVDLGLPSYYMPQCTGSPQMGGAIGAQWSRLVGSNGPLLGCPTSAELPTPNANGRLQNFQFGQIVSSPDQGPNMTVALYQAGDKLELTWGDTFPFSYDQVLGVVT